MQIAVLHIYINAMFRYTAVGFLAEMSFLGQISALFSKNTVSNF